MEVAFRCSDRVHALSIEPQKGGGFLVVRGHRKMEVDLRPISPNCLSLLIGNSSHLIYLAQDGDRKFVWVDGEQFCLKRAEDAHERRATPGAEAVQEGRQVISAPMPGSVVKVPVAEGDSVLPGQTMAIVEAMKMEHELKASIRGRVVKIHASEGDLVDAGQAIVEVEGE